MTSKPCSVSGPSAGCRTVSCWRGCRADDSLLGGGVLGPGGAAWTDGPRRLPAGARRRAHRRRCVPGCVPCSGARPVPCGLTIHWALALRREHPGGAAQGDFVRRAKSRESLEGFDRADPAEPSDVCEQAELRTVIDEEIARLPDRYRMAVVLCYLEGLTQEQAARRLRCPVGTVESRLHRARERLRSRLSRRGLAPSAGFLAWLSAETAQAHISVAAGRGDDRRRGPTLAGQRAWRGCAVESPGAYSSETIRSMMMTQGWRIGLMVLAAVDYLPPARSSWRAAMTDKRTRRPGRPKRRRPRRKTPGLSRRSPSDSPRSGRSTMLELQAVSRAVEATKTQREMNAIYTKMSPDEVAFTRRMIDLATSAPKDPGGTRCARSG